MVPFKGEYSKLDFVRSARFMGIPLTRHRAFRCRRRWRRVPITGCMTATARWRGLRQGGHRAFFVDDRDISDMNIVLDIAADVGADRAAVAEAVESAEIRGPPPKGRSGDGAGKGVFGSPYIVCDGEPFFGADRLPQLEARLAGKEVLMSRLAIPAHLRLLRLRERQAARVRETAVAAWASCSPNAASASSMAAAISASWGWWPMPACRRAAR